MNSVSNSEKKWSEDATLPGCHNLKSLFDVGWWSIVVNIGDIDLVSVILFFSKSSADSFLNIDGQFVSLIRMLLWHIVWDSNESMRTAGKGYQCKLLKYQSRNCLVKLKLFPKGKGKAMLPKWLSKSELIRISHHFYPAQSVIKADTQNRIFSTRYYLLQAKEWKN